VDRIFVSSFQRFLYNVKADTEPFNSKRVATLTKSLKSLLLKFRFYSILEEDMHLIVGIKRRNSTISEQDVYPIWFPIIKKND
jgi:hypothetical protein